MYWRIIILADYLSTLEYEGMNETCLRLNTWGFYYVSVYANTGLDNTLHKVDPTIKQKPYQLKPSADTRGSDILDNHYPGQLTKLFKIR